MPGFLTRARVVRNGVSQTLGGQSAERVGIRYAIRTTSAALASFSVCRALHIANPIWAIVSSVVVLLPSHRASVRTAGLRVIANMVGAGVGVAIAAIGLSMIPALVVGLFGVVGLCRLLAIDTATRSANVALVIVSLKEPGSVLGSSEIRILQVMLGCAIAFLVSLIAARIEGRDERVRGS